jgi:hypothetical protein
VLLFAIFGAILANRVDLWPRTVHVKSRIDELISVILVISLNYGASYRFETT